MAEAIQSASRWSTRPFSAVTSPPPPRTATSSPSSPRSKVAGPRFETRISGASEVIRKPRVCGRRRQTRAGGFRMTSCSLKALEDPQPVAQQPRCQEVLADVFLAGAPELLAEVGLAQDPQCAVGALLGRRHEVAGRPVLHLQRDAADVAADERARLPERLRDGQAEALTSRLLDQHLGL